MITKSLQNVTFCCEPGFDPGNAACTAETNQEEKRHMPRALPAVTMKRNSGVQDSDMNKLKVVHEK